jgi:hypothetical protein
LPACDREIGIDVGLVRLAVTSNGEVIANPRFLRAAERRLKVAQRAVCRRQKGSRNRDKARRRVAVLHRKVRDARLDYAHKTALALVRENQAVYAGLGGVRACPNQAGQVRPRCWLGAVAAADRGEGGLLRAHLREDWTVRADQPGLFCVRREGRSQAAIGT